ncbi:DUF488 domain-containing protein [Nocardiopsis metallicus]|uniref:Uncharacterized protein YeaO (DUF488 family) n=1 Tax=Nocardiopsis metallicus TaxID=179819 RepID=A0A840WIV2_9ACTN|nr:DUF488 family protein [Nocardiopsis metallicus]MBB5491617.1 uncharacterized protein YeaO (DUF488 family) [Nocardiopsis metallicus]
MADHRIHLERVYDEVRAEEHPGQEGALPPGPRFLVDRLWPRGVPKSAVAGHAWVRDVAPSPGLRTWFGHAPSRFAEFAERYRAELEARPGVLEPILAAARRGPVTLLYAARDTEHNHAVVLRDHLESQLSPSGSRSASRAPGAIDRTPPRRPTRRL